MLEESERVSLVPVTAETIVPAPLAEHESGPQAILRGSYVFPDGSPAPGVGLSLRSTASDLVNGLADQPEIWKDREARSDVEGRFELRFDPPLSGSLALEGSLEGFARTSWSWFEFLPGSVVDLGEIALERPGTIVGRVVDADGRPVLLPWMIWAVHEDEVESELTALPTLVEADSTTGEFRLEGLAPGWVSLGAAAHDIQVNGRPRVEVRSGEVVEATIRYEGPDVSKSLRIRVVVQPAEILQPEAATVRLFRGGVLLASAPQQQGASPILVFQELEPGTYEVAIEDPRFERWWMGGLQPGQAVTARLRGSAGIVLQICDAETSAMIPRYGLAVRFPRASESVGEHWLQSATTEPPADGHFDGLFPVACRLRVLADGYACAEIDLPDLAPLERRPLRIQLERGHTIAGIVQQADGRPAAGLTVELQAGKLDLALLEDRDRQVELRWERREPRVERTKAGGRFQFAGVASGMWTVFVSLGQGTSAFANVEIGVEDPEPIELRLPGPSFLEGRVLGEEGSDLEGLFVRVLPGTKLQVDPDDFFSTGFEDAVVTVIGRDGAFRVGPLSEGEHAVLLVHSVTSRVTFDETASGWQDGTLGLDRIRVRHGETLVREYQLGEDTPGRIRAQALLDGASLAGGNISFSFADANARVWGTQDLDAQGSMRSPPLRPGLWNIEVKDAGERWTYGPPQPIVIEPGRETSVHVDLDMTPGHMEVWAAGEGVLLTNTRVNWSCEDCPFSLRGSLETDDRGVLAAELAPGRYRMGTLLGEDPHAVLVDWTAAGPSPSKIELRRAHD